MAKQKTQHDPLTRVELDPKKVLGMIRAARQLVKRRTVAAHAELRDAFNDIEIVPVPGESGSSGSIPSTREAMAAAKPTEEASVDDVEAPSDDT